MRPLPSLNGWIVSNWACAIAAWTSNGTLVRAMNAHRSSIEAWTREEWGGTKVALWGEALDPSTHTCSERKLPGSACFLTPHQGLVDPEDRTWA